MSRRVGQNGNVFVKPNCKNGRCYHKKGLCPKYGRYWVDQLGQHERLRKVISFGEVTQTMAERKLRDHIRETQVDSPETFVEINSPTTTFKQQPSLKLSLPESSSAQKTGAQDAPPMVVTIDPKGNLRFGPREKVLTIEQLKEELQAPGVEKRSAIRPLLWFTRSQ